MKNIYTPKAIAGQSYPGYVKISLAQAKKLLALGQGFTGFIVGNKVPSFHFFGGWHLASRIRKNTLAEFLDIVQQWEWYNANPETGNHPAIFWKKPKACKGYVPTISLPLL